MVFQFPTITYSIEKALKGSTGYSKESSFKSDLNRAFKAQGWNFIRKGIVSKLYNKYRRGKMTKAEVVHYVRANSGLSEKGLSSAISKHYSKMYNIVKSQLGDKTPTALRSREIREIRRITKSMNDYTNKMIGNKIHKLLKSGKGKNKIMSEVRYDFSRFADYRSDRTMVNELTKARSTAIMDMKKSMGASRKRWLTCEKCSVDGSCKICRRNWKAGWVPVRKAFPSGHMYPPAHVGCQCSIT